MINFNENHTSKINIAKFEDLWGIVPRADSNLNDVLQTYRHRDLPVDTLVLNIEPVVPKISA